MAVSCGDYSSLWQYFVEGHIIKGWDCAMTGGEATAQLLFASVIFGGVGLSLFVTTGSLVIPSVLAILFGSVVLTLMPATFANIMLVVILTLLGGLGLLIAFRSGS
jgi:hypothetical protein